MAGSWGPKAELKLTPVIGILMPKQIKKIPDVYGTCIRHIYSSKDHCIQLIRLFPSFCGT